MKTRYRFIHFEALTDDVWICAANRDDTILGSVDMATDWRKWVFNPTDMRRFSEDCLQDIAHFLGQLDEPEAMKGL